MNIKSALAAFASIFGKHPAPDPSGEPPFAHMRDPQGDPRQYQEYLRPLRAQRRTLLAGLGKYKPEVRLLRINLSLANDVRYIHYLYAAGAELPWLAREAARCGADLDRNAQTLREHGGQYRDVHALIGNDRQCLAFAAIALLLVPDPALASSFHRLLSPVDDLRNELVDLLVKAFDPARPVSGRYARNNFVKPWADPVLRALALPPGQRAAALATYMNGWTRVMRQHGWKPDLDTASGNDALFSDFAFEVALAVCGWDIDDSAFAGHPYYPRDLVRYYREHIRHGRDAWRADGAGAGVPVHAPVPAPRRDLAASPGTGLARWMELLSDGDTEAAEAALARLPAPLEPEENWQLLEAMQLEGFAIRADRKDDDSVASQIQAMSEERGLGEFAAPAGPAAGIDRCMALLRAWGPWLAARGYRLVTIDMDDDGWNAVVVRERFHDELVALGRELRVPIVAPSAVLDDVAG